MKALAIASLMAFSGAAFAHVSGVVGPNPHIDINATSNQSASFTNSNVANRALGAGSTAKQNVSSNAGNVTVDVRQDQTTTLRNSSMVNEARNGGTATQSASSNLGHVHIQGRSTQTTFASGSNIHNEANGSRTLAVQNIASNNGCHAC